MVAKKRTVINMKVNFLGLTVVEINSDEPELNNNADVEKVIWLLKPKFPNN